MTTTERLPLSGRRDPPPNPPKPKPSRRHHETDSDLLLSIRNLLRTIVTIWVTLIVLGAIAGYVTWQNSQCLSSYSSSC